jgi:cytochrome oxidase Cu insertion factor (SCO1/SenC/PrrC family)
LWGGLAAGPTYTFRTLAALGAIGTVLVGAVPMAAAATSPHADLILAQAVDGTPNAVDEPAPGFNLVDQYDKPVSLTSLRGRTVALTFLDDTCTTDCPVIAQEFRSADAALGSAAGRVDMVAINANPRFITPDYLAAFDHQEGLEGVANWRYLTGSLPELEDVWRSYGEEVLYLPAGAMIGHSEFAYVIDATGHTRYILDTDPGPATAATSSSFSALLANTIKSVLGER